MKKLYGRKGTVHPTPPVTDQLLSFLPATILTLTVALSPQDREVLAYLISCSSNNFSSAKGKSNVNNTSRSGTAVADHPPSFRCNCFRCYMSYWVRWDSSPNRQLIHEIIDAFEDGLLVQSKKEKSRKERRRSKGGGGGGSKEFKLSEKILSEEELATESNSVEETSGGGGDGGEEEEEFEKGSVRRFVSFLGEKIWGVWT